MIISMISKLAALAFASSVMAGGSPPEPEPSLSPIEAPNSTVVFFTEPNCIGSRLVFPDQLNPDGCKGTCVEFNASFADNGSVVVTDSQKETTCYVFNTPGCNGNYSFARANSVNPPYTTCTNAEAMGVTMGSAQCFRGECKGR
jgi:hypothetical protein